MRLVIALGGNALLKRGVAAFGVARRFDLLLLSAAALPVS